MGHEQGKETRRVHLDAFVITVALCFATSAAAQLLPCDQVDVDPDLVPGGCIGKSLDDQVGAGQGDEFTTGSSIYLIKRDPARSVRRGRQLFQRKFTLAEGHGPRVDFFSTGDINENRALGAGLADSCAACHGRPRGSAGFGGDVQTRPDSRDAPHLFGLGLVEQLADEMTSDLREIQQAAIEDATNGGGEGVILEADFDADADGFVFEPDVFDTANPGYVQGGFVFEPDRNAFISLGGVDNDDIIGMSGGWTRTFDLSQSTNIVIRLKYQLTISGSYESDEFSEVRIRVDDDEFILDTLYGDSYWWFPQTITNVDYELTLPLSAGSHTLTLGGFNNKKTSFLEYTDVLFDDVIITGDNVGGPVTRDLITKGVHFGSITAFEDGSVDLSAIVGVDDDLRVRPFFHQGGTVTIREFIIGALNDEMGLQAVDPILCAVTDPAAPVAMTSPSGFEYDPTLDTFERPKACDTFSDPDEDGVSNEIDAALVDHLEFYLLNYFKAGQYQTTTRTDLGQELLTTIGCTSCHVPDLTIQSDRRVADVETNFDPERGIFNELFAEAVTLFDVVDDGQEFPLLVPQGNSFVVRNFYSDLKRHDLGPAFHEREFDGVTVVTEFVTEPLWGVGSTAPYGHDGRSINLDAVIRRHGGEAAEARDAYTQLSEDDQRAIGEFLQTLVLFPPDDTASSLNPGDPDDLDGIQAPSVHGTINLGALFQIDAEGAE